MHFMHTNRLLLFNSLEERNILGSWIEINCFKSNDDPRLLNDCLLDLDTLIFLGEKFMPWLVLVCVLQTESLCYLPIQATKGMVKWFDFYQQLNFDHEFYKRSALFSILSQNILLWWYFIASSNCISNSSLQFALHFYPFIHISNSCSLNLGWSNLLGTSFSSHLAVKKHIHVIKRLDALLFHIFYFSYCLHQQTTKNKHL